MKPAVFSYADYEAALREIESLKAQLAAEKAKHAELQRYNVDCTKQIDKLLIEKIDLKDKLAESQRSNQAAVECIGVVRNLLSFAAKGHWSHVKDALKIIDEWRGAQAGKGVTE